MKLKSTLMLTVIAACCLLLTGCFGGGSVAPMGWSGPVAVNGSLYVGAMDAKIVALDNIGADDFPYIRWSYPDETAIYYIYGDPVVDGETLYSGCYNGKVYAVDAVHGYKVWSYPVDSSDKIGAIVGSPAVADGVLYVGSSDRKLYAINTTTRQLVWQPFETGGKIWSTPVVYNGTVYIGSFDHNLYALDALSGDLLWQFEAGGAIVSTPLIYNDTLYFGSMDRNFYALDAATGTAKDGFATFSSSNWFWGEAVEYNGSIIAASLDGRIYALDAESGEKLWEAEAGGTVRGTPALVNNSVVVGTDGGSNKGKIYCFSADSGEQVWEYPSGDETMSAIHASIGAGDGVVYVHAVNQKIYCIDVEHGNILWSISTSGGE